MPNYSLIINSSFKPFSYAEMLAPVQAATQAHQELESAYSELETKANIWDKLANEETDSKAHDIYSKYANDLKSQAEELAKNGLSLSSRQALLNMKNRYTKEITPIEEAFNRRKDDIKAQKEMMQKDPYHMYDRLASTISLDEYMDNPNLDVLSANQSKLLLKEQVSKAAHNLKTVLTSVSGLRKLGLPFQYQQLVTRGYTPEQIMQTMMNDPQAAPILGKIVEDVMASSGIRNWSSMKGDWANNKMYKEAEQFAMQGLYDAIGGTEIKYHKDDYGMQLDLMKKKHALDNPPMDNNVPIDPVALRNPVEVEQINKEIDDSIKNGYIKVRPNGTYFMTNKGWNEYLKAKPNANKSLAMMAAGEASDYAAMQRAKAMPDTELSEFRKLMDKVTGGVSLEDPKRKGKIKAGYGPNSIGNMFAKFKANNSEGSYDTYHHTGYKQQVDATTGNRIMESIWSSAGTKNGKSVVQPVVFAGKNGWKEKGDPMTTEDLKDYRVIDKIYTKYGTVATLWKNGANPITVKIPKGMNDYYQQKVDAAVNSADEIQDILQTGRRPLTRTVSLPDNTQYQLIERDNNGNIRYTNEPLTQEDITLFRGRQREHLNSMMLYGSGPGAFNVPTNKTNALSD